MFYGSIKRLIPATQLVHHTLVALAASGTLRGTTPQMVATQYLCACRSSPHNFLTALFHKIRRSSFGFHLCQHSPFSCGRITRNASHPSSPSCIPWQHSPPLLQTLPQQMNNTMNIVKHVSTSRIHHHIHFLVFEMFDPCGVVLMI